MEEVVRSAISGFHVVIRDIQEDIAFPVQEAVAERWDLRDFGEVDAPGVAELERVWWNADPGSYLQMYVLKELSDQRSSTLPLRMPSQIPTP